MRLIPTKNRRQTLRMRRFLLAFTGYLVLLVAAFFMYGTGYIRDPDLHAVPLLALTLLLVNFLIYMIFRSELNRRFNDPSLTVPQLIVGIVFITWLSYYLVSSIRGAGLVGYVLVLLFGTFQLRLRDFLLLAVLAVVLYAAAMTLLQHLHPAAVETKLEIIRFFILLVALLWLSIMANYISTLRRKIERLASHDALTNIFNRRKIFELLDREKSLANRTGSAFSVCMLDIDDFKEINDTYGHPAGDEVLSTLARTLTENIREEDYVARYGGEEFLIVLVNANNKDSNTEYAERIRSIIEKLRFPEISQSLKITASIGVAAYQQPESVDFLVARADRALYNAKMEGKNRVKYL